MDTVAQKVCMAARGDVITGRGGVGEIMAAMRDDAAQDAAGSI